MELELIYLFYPYKSMTYLKKPKVGTRFATI